MNENYRCLKDVLDAAFKQASEGKGAERHGNAGGLDFMDQPMMTISALLNTDGGVAYQAIKKIIEARGLPTFERQERELLGAINYIAGMIMHLRRIDQQQRADADFDTSNAQLESLARDANGEPLKWSIGIAINKADMTPEDQAKLKTALESVLAQRKADKPCHSIHVRDARVMCNMFDLQQLMARNAPKSEPAEPQGGEDLIMMVNELQNAMVHRPDPDHYEGHQDTVAIVNAGTYWETGNRHPELYARRFVDVVKSQAIMNRGKTVVANMIGHHNGYTLDLTSQRDYILELLDRGGVFTVTTYPQKSLKHSLRVVYNH